jgi:hypothetical protein
MKEVVEVKEKEIALFELAEGLSTVRWFPC